MSQQLSEPPPTGAVAPRPDGPPPWAHLRPTNTKAILAVSLLTFAPAAIVFGVLARREIRRTGEGGWGLATWGMGIGIAVVALYVLYFLVLALYLVFVLGVVVSLSSSVDGVPTGL